MTMFVLYICVILYISSTLPRTSSQASQSDTCNSCCQGPAGIPGVPGMAGIPGNNGLPGRDGIKGDTGSKGDTGCVSEGGQLDQQNLKGQKGELGPQGRQGLPGKVGPRGWEGTPGMVGPAGHGGEKGQKGESNGSQRSAFSVAKSSSQIGSQFDILTFDTVYTNINGNFDTNSNKFTCQIPGNYLILFTICGHSTDNPYMNLVKNYSVIVSTYKYDYGTGQLEQSSNSVIVNLATGDKVWIRFGTTGRKVYSDSDMYTTFSGFLLYQD